MPIGGSGHPSKPAARRNLFFAVGLVAIWIPVVLVGMVLLWNYSTHAGAEGNPPTNWPTGAGFSRATDSMTLVMVVHPHCPCSRASIGELSQLMAHARRRLQAWVVFVRSAAYGDDWVKSD